MNREFEQIPADYSVPERRVFQDTILPEEVTAGAPGQFLNDTPENAADFRKILLDAKFSPDFQNLSFDEFRSYFSTSLGYVNPEKRHQLESWQASVKAYSKNFQEHFKAKPVPDNALPLGSEEERLGLPDFKAQTVLSVTRKYKLDAITENTGYISWPKEVLERYAFTCAVVDFYLKEAGFDPKDAKRALDILQPMRAFLNQQGIVLAPAIRDVTDAVVDYYNQKFGIHPIPKQPVDKKPTLSLKNVDMEKAPIPQQSTEQAMVSGAEKFAERHQEEIEKLVKFVNNVYQNIETLEHFKNVVWQGQLHEGKYSPLQLREHYGLEISMQTLGGDVGLTPVGKNKDASWLSFQPENEEYVCLLPLDPNYFCTDSSKRILDRAVDGVPWKNADVGGNKMKFLKASRPAIVSPDPDKPNFYKILKKGYVEIAT